MKKVGLRQVGCLDCTEANLRRRDFLRVGSLSFLGISLSQYLELKQVMAAAAPDKAKKQATAEACILIWLQGGASQVDTWDPKPGSGFKPISTSVPGIQISELLPEVARQMDRVAIIRSMETEEVNHPEAHHYALKGHRPNPAMEFPSFASIITKEMGPRNHVPPHVLTPGWATEKQYHEFFKAAFLGGEYNPLITSDPGEGVHELPDLSLPQTISPERIENRRAFQKIWDRQHRHKVEVAEHADLDTFQEKALSMIMTPAVKEAFDLSLEPEKMRDGYGRDGVGRSLLMARRLVEAGSRFVTANGFKFNSWDTHGDNDSKHAELVPRLDKGLAFLLEDLDQRGLLESTVVLVMGEFGRTPHINPNFGRDHWPYCWSLVLAGGGIRGGQVVGVSDERAAYVAERRVTMGDLHATVYKALGIDWTKEYMSPVGRPVKIANSVNDETGVPIAELV